MTPVTTSQHSYSRRGIWPRSLCRRYSNDFPRRLSGRRQPKKHVNLPEAAHFIREDSRRIDGQNPLRETSKGIFPNRLDPTSEAARRRVICVAGWKSERKPSPLTSASWRRVSAIAAPTLDPSRFPEVSLGAEILCEVRVKANLYKTVRQGPYLHC